MNLRWTEEEEIFARSVREFLAAECTPAHVRRWEGEPLGFSRETIKKMADMGWLGIALPEKAGGLGQPFDYLTILFHQMGHHLPHGPILETVVAGLLLRELPASGGWNKLLSRLARGDTLCTLTLHVGALRLRATPGRVTGSLRFVPYAAGSDLLLAIAEGRGSPRLLLIPSQSKGLRAEPVEVTSGERLYHVRLKDCPLGKENIHILPAHAWELVQTRASVLAAAYLLGMSERALEFAVEHAKQREQFGRPIGSFQAVQHLVADIRVKIEGLRLLVYEASWAISTGRAAPRLAAMAKFWANATAYTATKNAHQVLAGYGVMAETNLQLYYRRAKGWMINKGAGADMLDRVAATL
ncbi:MAG: acyl-CoA/acyl-ACP dehydrogenase [Nitrospirae bacterium]|nr:acyl-CoA/acyl-ACP dehydrogenase [Nitrospirota bacterium]